MRPERSTATAPVRSHPAGQGQLLGGTRGRAAPPAPQSPPLPACARDAGLAPGPTRVKSSRVCIAGGGGLRAPSLPAGEAPCPGPQCIQRVETREERDRKRSIYLRELSTMQSDGRSQ